MSVKENTQNSKSQSPLEPEAMNASIPPTQDLYRHVNGTWLDTHIIPDDRAIDGTFSVLRDRSEEHCKAIIEDCVAGKVQDPDAQRIASLYCTFMDLEAIEKAGTNPLENNFSTIEAAVNSDHPHTELAKTVGKLMRTGISGLVGIYIGADRDHPTTHLLHLYQSGIGLPDEAFYREESYGPIREAYVSHIAKMFTLAGATADAAATNAEAVMKFETALAATHWDTVACRDAEATNNPTPWGKAVASAPGFAWDKWAEAIGLPIEADTSVCIMMPDQMAATAALWEQTPASTLACWLRWELLRANSAYLPDAFGEESFSFYGQVLQGQPARRVRWKRGVALVEEAFGEALGRIYVSRHFAPELHDAMMALVASLVDAYHDSISKLDWMGEQTRHQALTKLGQFVPKIGYPKKWRDYSTIEISGLTLTEQMAVVGEYSTEFEIGRLTREVDRDEWFMTPQTVNAYYSPTHNEIVFPAGILQPPYFDINADLATNYGAIGAVIGHEIGHGFDDQGSKYDGHGRLQQWWTDSDLKEFEKRTKALIEQFDAFTPALLQDTEHHVNGALTIGENIGDLGGLSIALKAWKATLGTEGKTDQINAVGPDGLTGIQRFFISWARAWRSLARNEMAIQLLAVDPHSPAEFRCNGIVRNIDDFHSAFGTKPGDEMWLEPENRVKIW